MIDVALGEESLAVPHAILHVQVPQAHPVARRQNSAPCVRLLPYGSVKSVASRMPSLSNRLRCGQVAIVLAALLDREANEVVHEHGIGVAIAPTVLGFHCCGRVAAHS
ncbi:MAG: hypothetical protein IPJ56_04800 [Gemmatimonadetes bacterium]|nr:hypothetical protein [Gemmatimonadota bacterium]